MNKMPAKSNAMPKSYRKLSALLVLITMSILSACSIVQSPSITKIALLAPFEGRHREIGYNALYAVRLAIAEHPTQDIQLLAVDDGDNLDTTIDRIHALNIDPSVNAIIALGSLASHPNVQQANDKPMLIVGFWGHTRADDTLIMTNPQIAEQVTTTAPMTDLDLSVASVGGDLYMLKQLSDLYPALDNLTVISSGALPDDDFYNRYVSSDLYVPEPNLLATLTYDATQLILTAIDNNKAPADIHYEGINGTLSFVDGYWSDAPINRYYFHDGAWMIDH